MELLSEIWTNAPTLVIGMLIAWGGGVACGFSIRDMYKGVDDA